MAAARGQSGQDEHRIAEAVEAVALGDGLLVGLECEFGAGEGADEHEKGRAGQVEIGDEDIDEAERVAGEDAKLGPAFVRLKTAALGDDMFERPDHRRPDGDDPPPVDAGGSNGGGSLCRDGDVLGVEVVVAGVFDLDRPEGAGADFEGDGCSLDAGFIERFEECGGEVEAGGGGGGAPGDAAVNGLVAFGVAFVAGDVGRERDGADGGGIEGALEFEEDDALGALDDSGTKRPFGGVELEEPAGDCLAARPEEYFPAAVGEGPDKEHFDGAAGIGTDAVEAGGHDAGIVHDEEVARAEEGGEFAKDVMGDGASGAADEEEAGGIAWCGGLLGDQFPGEFEVEVARTHSFEHCAFMEPGLG